MKLPICRTRFSLHAAGTFLFLIFIPAVWQDQTIRSSFFLNSYETAVKVNLMWLGERNLIPWNLQKRAFFLSSVVALCCPPAGGIELRIVPLHCPFRKNAMQMDRKTDNDNRLFIVLNIYPIAPGLAFLKPSRIFSACGFKTLMTPASE